MIMMMMMMTLLLTMLTSLLLMGCYTAEIAIIRSRPVIMRIMMLMVVIRTDVQLAVGLSGTGWTALVAAAHQATIGIHLTLAAVRRKEFHIVQARGLVGMQTRIGETGGRTDYVMISANAAGAAAIAIWRVGLLLLAIAVTTTTIVIITLIIVPIAVRMSCKTGPVTDALAERRRGRVVVVVVTNADPTVVQVATE